MIHFNQRHGPEEQVPMQTVQVPFPTVKLKAGYWMLSMNVDILYDPGGMEPDKTFNFPVLSSRSPNK
jgi:hypothetical protein